MNDADRFKIAEAALRALADDCPKCNGYGRVPISDRCKQCEPAREALRKMGRVVL